MTVRFSPRPIRRRTFCEVREFDPLRRHHATVAVPPSRRRWKPGRQVRVRLTDFLPSRLNPSASLFEYRRPMCKGLRHRCPTSRLAPALLALALNAAPALADSGGFVVVIPGRPGVPIIINGRDASYAVVESDWGLARGVHVQPTIYGGRPVVLPPVGHYYPGSAQLPGYGRLEVEPPPNRPLPKPAESFHQSWEVQSNPPAPAPPPVPMDPPQVIIAPPLEPGMPQPPRPDFRGPRG